MTSAESGRFGEEYRPDIDGLRGLAVLAVLSFHADVSLLRGGFIGVDVFFVVSGYLISGIIFRALAKGTFSFTQFYARRINRIFPALIVVLLAVVIAGWPILYPGEFKALGKHVLAGAAFVSNLALWSEAGYFDSANKPLLHLWSLGVEEQFYLLWPVLAVIAWKKRLNLGVLLSVIIALSFIVNVIELQTSRGNAAFFSPLTRLWEILSGGALFIWSWEREGRPSRLSRDLLSIAGAASLALSLFLVSKNTPWPGLLALVPVTGTLCLISAGREAVANRLLLSQRWLVAVGLISYPLYLWHWPLMVYIRLANEAPISRVGKVWVMALSVILAALTYLYVEKPIRFRPGKERKALYLLPAMGVAAVLGILIRNQVVTPRMNDPRVATVERALGDRAPVGHFVDGGTDIAVYQTPGDSSRPVVVMGDSHAAQYFYRFESLGRTGGQRRPRAVFVTYGGCPPFPGVNHIGISWDGSPFRCDFVHAKALERASAPNVASVVYAAWWETYFEEQALYLTGDAARRAIPFQGPLADSLFGKLESEMAILRNRGKKVYIVLSNPASRWLDPYTMLPSRLRGETTISRVTSIARDSAELRREPIAGRLRTIARRTGARILDPFDDLCDASRCATLDETGSPIYRDDHHIRASYAARVARFLDPAMSEAPLR